MDINGAVVRVKISIYRKIFKKAEGSLLMDLGLVCQGSEFCNSRPRPPDKIIVSRPGRKPNLIIL